MDKEELVRNLVDSFEHRNHMHMHYKKIIKKMLLNFFDVVIHFLGSLDESETVLLNDEVKKKIVDEYIQAVIRKED